MRARSRSARWIHRSAAEARIRPLWTIIAGWRSAVRAAAGALRGDAGMSTAEYAMGTIAAAAFASVLYAVVTSDGVRDAVTSLIERGLQDVPV
ncbi:DUF4244 domain-containing protein [Salinifilum aidingensis]